MRPFVDLTTDEAAPSGGQPEAAPPVKRRLEFQGSPPLQAATTAQSFYKATGSGSAPSGGVSELTLLREYVKSDGFRSYVASLFSIQLLVMTAGLVRTSLSRGVRNRLNLGAWSSRLGAYPQRRYSTGACSSALRSTARAC